MLSSFPAQTPKLSDFAVTTGESGNPMDACFRGHDVGWMNQMLHASRK